MNNIFCSYEYLEILIDFKSVKLKTNVDYLKNLSEYRIGVFTAMCADIKNEGNEHEVQ